MWRMQLPDKTWTYIEVYVDDIFGCISPGKDQWLSKFVEYLETECAPCKSLGEIKSCLGIEISWSDDRKKFSISCKDKILALLERHNLQDIVSRATPLEPGVNFEKLMADSPKLDAARKEIYQSIVGSLLYIMRIARPDIYFAVWLLACGMSTPTEAMFTQAIHCLRYLSGTIEFLLTYSIGDLSYDDWLLIGNDYSSSTPYGFCDSNWSASRSVSSNVIMWNNAALLWRVRKQRTVSLSSVEAELMALSSEGQDVQYLRDIFEWFHVELPKPTSIRCDNRGAIQNAKHPSYSDRLRHVDNKIFHIRYIIEQGIAVVQWISGAINPADLGTKPVGANLQRLFGSFLMGMPITAFRRTTKFSRFVRSSNLANNS